MSNRRVLVTGGAGFIGSAVCRYLVERRGYRVINVDKLTYAGNLLSLASISDRTSYRFEQVDISDKPAISALLREEHIDSVMHLAAETHVDRSIASPTEFIGTNVVGTFCLLEAVTEYWRQLNNAAQQDFRFHHVSTDEVFGDVARPDHGVTAITHYRPSSPYSASKAASEHLVSAWCRTYGLPALISNSSNSYGPYQFPDKLIPLTIVTALQNQPLPLYGTGANVRNWLFVEDHVRALELVLRKGRIGESYHIGERGDRTNLEVVRLICCLLDERRPLGSGRSYEELITFVPDRPGHDRCYAFDPSKVQAELDWRPIETFETGLAKTVDWYLQREDWWQSVLEKSADANPSERKASAS